MEEVALKRNLNCNHTYHTVQHSTLIFLFLPFSFANMSIISFYLMDVIEMFPSFNLVNLMNGSRRGREIRHTILDFQLPYSIFTWSTLLLLTILEQYFSSRSSKCMLPVFLSDIDIQLKFY